MKRLIVLLIVFTIAGIPAIARRRTSRRKSVLISASKPAVYLTLVKIDQASAATQGPEEKEAVLIFRLTNNTRWDVWLQMGGLAGRLVSEKRVYEADLFFAIKDSEKGTIREGSYFCHVCSYNPLPPGKSVYFPVPMRSVTKDADMWLSYTFDWEKDKDSSDGSYSAHFVVYDLNGLPKSVLTQAGK